MPLQRHRARQERTTNASDEHLVARAQSGDREAFAALYDRYLPLVYAYCYRLLGEREAAEDANTDVFMRALAALPGYRAGSFRSWLFTIAHNVATDAMRRRWRIVSLESIPEVIDPGGFEEAAAHAADWRQVERLVPLLSEDQQQVVALRLAGLSAAEIGDVLGKPRNAIDGLHHRALLRLRSLLANGEPASAREKGGGCDG